MTLKKISQNYEQKINIREALAIIATLVGLASTIVGGFVALRMAPLAERISVIEAKQDEYVKTLKEIKESMIRIEAKLDNHLVK